MKMTEFFTMATDQKTPSKSKDLKILSQTLLNPIFLKVATKLRINVYVTEFSISKHRLGKRPGYFLISKKFRSKITSKTWSV